MSIQASVFIATSLDGFIAREDGSIDWLDKANAGVPPGEDFGYVVFFASVDVLIMGRNAYEQVRTFGEWPYGDKRVVVLSRHPMMIPAELAKTVSSSSETPDALVRRLAGEGAKRLYVDGGVTIQRFLAAGLIDDLTITLIPVLLGAGKPFFGPLGNDISLTHQATKTFECCGFVQVIYRIAKNS